MATATESPRVEALVGEALIAPAEAASATRDRKAEYHCDCGHVLRVFGGGRHRVYFEPGNVRLDDPVMNRVCPTCGRVLPGKNRP